jgi:hypothetical protein
MKIYNFQEEKQKRYETIFEKGRPIAFPHAGTIEDNLKPGEKVYRFNAECYKNTMRAIQIWHDIWLPKSQIKIVWCEMQVDYIGVTLSVPKWLVKKTLLDNYLKVD